MKRLDLPLLLILRHGETEWNLADRMQGWADSPLTATGRAQAEAQGRLLQTAMPETCALRSSPSERALDTARIALGARAGAVQQDARLRELNVGDWVGHTPQEIAAEYDFVRPQTDRHLWKFHAPGGETLADMISRCRSLLEELEGPSVLVTHGVTSRLIRCLALGLAPEKIGTLPGGQGVVHVIKDGKAHILRE